MNTRSSELHREAEQALNNAARLHVWRQRYLSAFGTLPETDPAKAQHRGIWSLYLIKQILRGKDTAIAPPRPVRRETHGNSNVVKFPRYRHQYQRADLPTGPEVA